MFLFMKSKGANWQCGSQNHGVCHIAWLKAKHMKIKSSLKHKSVCGRVVKPSGLSTALSSYTRSIRGSILDGARFTHNFFFNFES